MIGDASRIGRISDKPTVGEIRKHLQLAIEIEHATIPAYMSALFSLKDGTNRDPAFVIHTVAVEEMLHMSLAANVLNAIGGRPAIKNPAFVPEYPTVLPHFYDSPFVQIEPFSKDAIRTFMQIERRRLAREYEHVESRQYRTIGEFYRAIERALKYVCCVSSESVVFSGDTSKQIPPSEYYGSEGSMIVVQGLETALKALHLIVDQGEGDAGTGHELKSGAGERVYDETSSEYFSVDPGRPRFVAHLYRFYEIYKERYYAGHQAPYIPGNLRTGKLASEDELEVELGLPPPTGPPLPVDWSAVWPIRKNPKAAQYPRGSEIRNKLDEFNRAYTDLLDVLERAFNGEPSQISETVPKMYELKYRAENLSRMPSGDGFTTVGPSWEFLAD